MMKNIFENQYVKIEIEPNEIPWLKIFTQKNYKEFSQCPQMVKEEIFRLLDVIEKQMLDYYIPEKINIASFGNYVPHVHFHIMARFKEDAYFPEPMWGKQQRESRLQLPCFDTFIQLLQKKL